MCSSHSQIQQYLYEQSYNFEEVQLQRIKLEWGAFRFQTVPLKAEKHRPLAFAVTCGPPRSTGPLVTASPAPHQSYPTRTAPANRTELRAQDVLGMLSRKQQYSHLLAEHWPPSTGTQRVQLLGAHRGSLEASVGQCPALMTTSGATGHGSCPRRSGNKLLEVPSDVGSGNMERDTGGFL